jgi:hypothetical protein
MRTQSRLGSIDNMLDVPREAGEYLAAAFLNLLAITRYT